jgi:hypothetical protein
MPNQSDTQTKSEPPKKRLEKFFIHFGIGIFVAEGFF